MVYDGGVGVVSIMRKSEKIKVMRAVHSMSWWERHWRGGDPCERFAKKKSGE